MKRQSTTRMRRSIVKAAELAVAAPQVAAIRTARMLAAGANPGAADRAEFSRMRTEKVQAFWESMFAMGAQIIKTNQEYAQKATLECWRLWTTPAWSAAYRPVSQAIASSAGVAGRIHGLGRGQLEQAMSKVIEVGLAPVHKRATANARRLRKTKRR